MIPISWLYSTGKEEKIGWRTVLTLKSTDPNFVLKLELKTNLRPLFGTDPDHKSIMALTLNLIRN